LSAGRRLRRGETIVLATHNQGKVAEFQALLAPYGLVVTSAAAVGLSAPEETAPDFSGNAALKAGAAARAAGLPALADDSGFTVAALGGDPGVRSARWVTEAGGTAGAMRLVHERASLHPDRRAAFVCALALAWPDGAVTGVEGRIDGTWVWPPRGDGGFGYDPMFMPDRYRVTFAEMTSAEKDAISHRAIALSRLAAASLP
jgi:XTP/dITP diphosphohydrolase